MSRGGGKGGNARPTGVTALANALGIQRGEIVTQTVSQPPPLFPPLDCKPLPLSTSDDYAYMALVKNEFSNRMRESPYFLKEREPKRDIDRYSDKYRKVIVEPWTPYYNRLPKELWPKHMLDPKESTSRPSKRRKIDEKADINFSKKLETLEKRESQRPRSPAAEEADEEGKKKRPDDEEEDAEAKDEEQELSDDDYQEEVNDYIQNYFDNGDNYLDESEDNIEDEAYY